MIIFKVIFLTAPYYMVFHLRPTPSSYFLSFFYPLCRPYVISHLQFFGRGTLMMVPNTWPRSNQLEASWAAQRCAAGSLLTATAGVMWLNNYLIPFVGARARVSGRALYLGRRDWHNHQTCICKVSTLLVMRNLAQTLWMMFCSQLLGICHCQRQHFISSRWISIVYFLNSDYLNYYFFLIEDRSLVMLSHRRTTRKGCTHYLHSS